MKREQSKAQQQYIQDFFKKKPCQRQVDAVKYSAGQSQSTRQGQVGQQIIPEPGSTGQSRPERASEDHTSSHLSAATEHEQCLQKVH